MLTLVVPSAFLPGWSGERVRATLMRLDGRGEATHVLTTPAEDEVELLRLFSLDDRFGLAVLRGQRLVDGSGALLHEGEDTWIAVGIQLVED